MLSENEGVSVQVSGFCDSSSWHPTPET